MDDLNVLWERYLNNTCTRQELEKLLAAADSDELRSVMEQHWQNSIAAEGIPNAAAKLEAIFAKPTPRRIPYYVAAAITVGIIAGLYGYFKPGPEKPVVKIVAKTESSRKYNKAVLTLADGSTVTLDSAGNKLLQQQPGVLQYAGKSAAIGFNTLTTPRGEQYQIILPDGSKVWLNAASDLKYPTVFNGKERSVELHGQAYFEIAKNADQPFKVKVNNQEILVLGTSFDVMAYANENTTNTTLIEGSVKVTVDNTSKLLQPGQQAAVENDTRTIGIKAVNIDDVIAWKNGYFSFRNADLPTVMRQLARWYDVEISYQQNIPPGTFSGEIGKSLSLEQALKILEQTRVHFKIEGRRIVILPQ
jgi:transmembrane sensor